MINITSDDFQFKNTAVALGKFEGVHRGHQLLLEEIKQQKKNGLQSVVFTFDMPPKSAISGDLSYQQIYTKEERRFLLQKMGIDIMIEHPFTKEFSSLSPEDFIRHVLVEKVGARVVVVGTDFRFGKKRSGGIEHLQQLAGPLGYELIVKEKLKEQEEDISSTRVRGLLKEGDMENAALLLGRPYSVIGEVVHGKALGRAIHIPTVNQMVPQNKLTPPNGVYVSRVWIEDECYYGITNVGVKPTVQDQCVKGVETNIFNFDKDVYDQQIQVEFLHFCRPEMKFDSLEQLKQQLDKDVAFGQQYVAALK